MSLKSLNIKPPSFASLFAVCKNIFLLNMLVKSIAQQLFSIFGSVCFWEFFLGYKRCYLRQLWRHHMLSLCGNDAITAMTKYKIMQTDI